MATVYEADYSVKTVVFDSTGRVVFDFGKERVSGYDPVRHWVYVADEQNRTGIRDTLGREILPMQYQNLNWYREGVFFTSELPDGKRQLCNAEGKVVLSNFRYLQRLDDLPDGHLSAITDDTCHILAPDMRVLCRLPGKEIEKIEAYPDLIRVKDEQGGARYVHFRKGIVYGGN